jgi:thymidylate synthase
LTSGEEIDLELDRMAFAEVVDLLIRLHRPKDQAYGDAWRKRGEVLGIFANIARKADRLERARLDQQPAAAEELGDTVADLAIYSGKYLTWLAETHPLIFEAVGPEPRAAACDARLGAEALERVLEALTQWQEHRIRPMPRDVTEAWDYTATSFSALEAGIIAQAERPEAPQMRWKDKVEVAWDLTDGSTWLLVRLGQSDRVLLDALRASVDRIESRT